MSTQDTLTAAVAAKDSVVDSLQAALPVALDTLHAAANAVASKAPTLADTLSSLGFSGVFMLLATTVVVLVLIYIAICVNRIAVVLESGKGVSVGKASSAASPAVPVASTPATSIHPGLSDEKLAVLIAVATAEVLGKSATVVKFRAADGKDWTWAQQGRVALHTHKV